jgi:hypothetical protein
MTLTPCDGTKGGHEIDKVSKDLGSTLGRVQEHQKAERGAEQEGRPGDTHLVDAPKDTGGFTLEGQSVQCTRANVQVRVGSGHDKDENRSTRSIRDIKYRVGVCAPVDDMSQPPDTQHGSSDDEWRSSGTSGCASGNKEVLRGTGDNQADDEYTSNVEHQDTEEGCRELE